MSIDSDLKWVSSGSGPIYILSLILDSCQILSIDIQITFHFDNKPWTKQTIICESIRIDCIYCSVLWSSTHGGWENDEEVDGKIEEFNLFQRSIFMFLFPEYNTAGYFH